MGMNCLERTQSAVRGEAVDYPPTFPILIAPACQLVGVKQREYSLDPAVMAETLIRARDLCGFDGIYVSRDNWIYHQALGGEMVFPEDDESFAPRTVLDSIRGFSELSVPDPFEAPGMKTVLAAAQEVVRRVGNQFYIQANVDVGPFSLAGILRGIQDFMMDVATEDPRTVHPYLEFCTEAVIAYCKAMVRTGVHGIQYGDSVASLISREQNQEYVLPYLKRSLEALKGSPCDLWIHICGKTNHILDLLEDLPIQGFEVDALVDIAEARSLLGPRMALKGNVDTTFLLTESPEAVYRATQDVIRAHGSTGGLVVSPGCGVARMTPLENLRAMVSACREWCESS